MLTRLEAFRRISLAFRDAVKLDATTARFIDYERLDRRGSEVLAQASDVYSLDDDRWADLLDPRRAWLNITLYFDTDGNPIIALTPGEARVPFDPARDVPIAASRDLLPLRVVDRGPRPPVAE